MRFKALFDCTADDDGELSFKRGNILVNVEESEEEGWYRGTLQGTHEQGLFPHNYVERIEEPTTIPSRPTSPIRVDCQDSEPPTRSGVSLPPANDVKSQRAAPGVATVDHDDDLEDDDGYQLVKPSHVVRQQRQRQASQIPKGSTITAGLKSKETQTLFKQTRLDPLLQASNTPRLPLRPVTLPVHRPSIEPSRTTSIDSAVARVPPPTAPKPKHVHLTSSTLKPLGKARSASNPIRPPVKPKPSLDPALQVALPGIAPPSLPLTSRPPITSVADPLYKPSILRARARAMTNPADAAALFSASPSMVQKPVLASVGIARTASQPEATTTPKKLTAPSPRHTSPPPPPPSRPRYTTHPPSDSCYIDLFNKIHDDGYVDGETAGIVWRRSRLPDTILARVWQQCDPKRQGLLNRQAFVDGMRTIDGLLRK